MSGSCAVELRRWRAATVFELEDRYAWRLRGKGLFQPAFGPVAFSVVGELANGTREEWACPLRLQVAQSPGSRFYVCGWFAEAGRPAQRRVQEGGVYVVRIRSLNYQAEEIVDVAFARERPRAYFRQLRPGYAYPFPSFPNAPPTLLYGQVLGADGRGAAGVRVAVHGHADALSYSTDGTGRWVLPLDELFAVRQPSVTVQLDLTAPGLADQQLTVQVPRGRRVVERPLALPI